MRVTIEAVAWRSSREMAQSRDSSPGAPVIFLNTNKHFPETLAYRHDLVKLLGLKGVRDIEADLHEVARLDSEGMLHADNYDACCGLRKVQPLERALVGFEIRIAGRKRSQNHGRGLPHLIPNKYISIKGRKAKNSLKLAVLPGGVTLHDYTRSSDAFVVMLIFLVLGMYKSLHLIYGIGYLYTRYKMQEITVLGLLVRTPGVKNDGR